MHNHIQHKKAEVV